MKNGILKKWEKFMNDNQKLMAILTVGLPASGKSTWAKEFCKEPYWVQIERDKIRAGVYGNFPDYRPSNKAEKVVTDVHTSQIEKAFEEGKNIVISDTNVNPNTRARLVSYLNELGYEVSLKYFTDVPYNVLHKRNRAREWSVPEAVIDNMALKDPKLFDWANKELSTVDEFYQPNNRYPCVIVDVDGTIADMNGRSPYDMTKVGEDESHETVMMMIEGFCHSYQLKHGKRPAVIIVTARSTENNGEENTRQWLKEKCFSYDKLVIRQEGDTRKDNLVKNEMFWKEIEPFHHPVMVFDDRRQVVSMWKNLFTNSDTKIIQIHHGGKRDDF